MVLLDMKKCVHAASNPTIAFDLLSISWASLNSISCNKNNCYSYLTNRFELLEKRQQHLPLDFTPLGKSPGLPPRDETTHFCSL